MTGAFPDSSVAPTQHITFKQLPHPGSTFRTLCKQTSPGLSFLHALTLRKVPCSTPECPCQSSLGHLCLHLAPWTATCFHLFQQYLLTVFSSLVGEHRRVPWRRLANYFRSPVLKFHSYLVHCNFSYSKRHFLPSQNKDNNTAL